MFVAKMMMRMFIGDGGVKDKGAMMMVLPLSGAGGCGQMTMASAMGGCCQEVFIGHFFYFMLPPAHH